jgi:hypothetical protein
VAAGLSRGLVGYWRFDDGAGSTHARDFTGFGNDCLLRKLDPATSWTDGPLAGALSFDGQGWLECPRVEALAKLSSEMTIAVWTKRTGQRQSVRALATRQFEGGDLDIFHFGFRDDQLWMRSRIKGGPAFAPFPAALGRWHHVAATVAADGEGRLYIDGELVHHKIKEGRPSLGGGSSPLIVGGGINGSYGGEVKELFQGVMDELVIFDRALSREEIAALAAGTQPRLSP